MKKLIVIGKLPKNLPCIVTDFDEEYTKYLRKASKNWKSPEGFSLEFNSTLSDLRKAHFLYVNDEKLELLIKKHLKVIEEL